MATEAGWWWQVTLNGCWKWVPGCGTGHREAAWSVSWQSMAINGAILCCAYTPLLRFVDLLYSLFYSMSYNKSITDRSRWRLGLCRYHVFTYFLLIFSVMSVFPFHTQPRNYLVFSSVSPCQPAAYRQLPNQLISQSLRDWRSSVKTKLIVTDKSNSWFDLNSSHCASLSPRP